jgi:hypothetical protein
LTDLDSPSQGSEGWERRKFNYLMIRIKRRAGSFEMGTSHCLCPERQGLIANGRFASEIEWPAQLADILGVSRGGMQICRPWLPARTGELSI